MFFLFRGQLLQKLPDVYFDFPERRSLLAGFVHIQFPVDLDHDGTYFLFFPEVWERHDRSDKGSVEIRLISFSGKEIITEYAQPFRRMERIRSDTDLRPVQLWMQFVRKRFRIE